jgi:SAM-dependent methyltransferase
MPAIPTRPHRAIPGPIRTRRPHVLPNHNADFDAYSESYDHTVNSALGFAGAKVDFFSKVKADCLKQLISDRFTDLGRTSVLDVGCGVGNSLSLLAGTVGRLAGVDVSEACIARARRRSAEVECATYDGLHLPHPDATFDMVFSVCVFHHIALADRVPLARDIRRVLRPNGTFAIFEHNPRNPLTMRVVKACEFDKTAILLRSADTETLMLNAGFQEVFSRFILTVPPAGPLLRYVDRIFSRLPFGAQYYTCGRV